MKSIPRPLYGQAELRRLLAPRSVAIVGASAKPSAFSNRTLENMAHFKGDIFLVNPRYEQLGDYTCYPSLADLPMVPDCVVVALPQDAVVDAVRAAADVGAGGAIIFASGFAETGLTERVAQQQELADIARESGLRVLGPNCLGVANNLLGAGLLFQMGYAGLDLIPGRIGLVSQSGALGYAVLQGMKHGLAYTHMLTAGNSCDVDTLDLAHYLLEDAACKAVACVFEAAGNATRLQSMAERARDLGKPVIVYKTAVGEIAAAAAQSHTGSLTSSSRAFEAAMRRGHFVQAHSLAELTEMADFFAKAPAPKAQGIAVMATSGGAAIMCADAASNHGLSLPQPCSVAQQILDANVPEFGSPRNPCDITGQVLNNPQAFEACAKAMMDDPVYGALILPQVTAGQTLADQRCPVVSRLAQESGKPVCIIWLSDWLEGPGAATYARDERIGFFRDTERCFKTLAQWHTWHSQLALAHLQKNAPPWVSPSIDARELLRQQPQVITERVAKQLLAAYGLPVVKELNAATDDDAILAADLLGYPVVLKFDAPGIAHKSELGLVKVGLRDADSVAAACAAMRQTVAQRLPGQKGGFLLQPMERAQYELVLGMKRDPVFGPLLLVGLGGVLVEVLGDVVTELAPVSVLLAHDMLRRLKTYRLLQGYRGQPGVDLDALAQCVADFSKMCMDLADEVEEIDINPVMANENGLVAVDALIVRRKQNKTAEIGDDV